MSGERNFSTIKEFAKYLAKREKAILKSHIIYGFWCLDENFNVIEDPTNIKIKQ